MTNNNDSDSESFNELDGDYELMLLLGLIEDEPTSSTQNVAESEADFGDESDYEGDVELTDGWSYMVRYEEEAWRELINARIARHHNIVLREFTRRLPNISEQMNNGLFDAFSKSSAFGV